MAWWTVQWFPNSFATKFKSQFTTKIKETINIIVIYLSLKAVAVKQKMPGYIKPRDGNNLVENFSHSKKNILEQFSKGGQSFFHNLCINLYKLDEGRPWSVDTPFRLFWFAFFFSAISTFIIP